MFHLNEVFFMAILLQLFLVFFSTGIPEPGLRQQKTELEIVQDLFRLRNEHKADSAEKYFSDTVQIYMKYLRNISRKKITQSDKSFWKAHPKNKFEITAPVQIVKVAGNTVATVIGKEYLDGTTFQFEKIEIKFDRNKKIYSYQGFKWKKEK